MKAEWTKCIRFAALALGNVVSRPWILLDACLFLLADRLVVTDSCLDYGVDART